MLVRLAGTGVERGKDVRIGVDVGGTFTDVVLVEEESSRFLYAKTPTTHGDLAEGVMEGIAQVLAVADMTLDKEDYLIHGTTIGTNAIVESKGARVGLITTAGFEDVLEIRRVARPKEAAFDFQVDNPPPMVPRYLRRGVKERIRSDGSVLTPLDRDSVWEVAEFFKSQGVQAVVVCLLFSFLNPDHEQRVAAICREVMPEVPVSLSYETCPEFREYERTCTTVMNGYLGPVVETYMRNLQDRLVAAYGDIRLHIMQSNGGSMSAQVAGSHAAHLINSGPAAGAMAAAHLTQALGREYAIGADMGGTTFDISIIDNGIPRTTTWGGVTEYPIKLPMVDMKTIGAGGGSIAWVDEHGVLYVGPQSAGSDPGPACYGWGGVLPTVSDANLLLGRLNPSYFLGGKLSLYPEKARTAVTAHVSEKMGMTVDEAALSIIRIANANMAKGISAVSVEKGYDLREFVLIPFGGAAANHAVEIARELGIAQVVVPEICGSFSAVGLVVSDIQHDLVRTIGCRQDEVRPDHLLAIFREMEVEGMAQLTDEGVKPEQMVLEWAADLRYEGQSWELTTPLTRVEQLSGDDVAEMIEGFHALHQKVYSYSERSQPIEFINLRVKAIGRNPQISLPRYDPESRLPDVALKSTRQVCVGLAGWASVPIYERSLLPTGSQVAGPAVIEEQISTTFLPPGSSASIDEFRNIAIEVWSE